MRFSGTKVARRITAAASAIALMASVGASGVLAGGPPSLAFYVDDVRYRTVGTPTDFFGTGAPDFTYDNIYDLGYAPDGSKLINVADSKPGDRDFNGGRWLVYDVIWVDIDPYQLTNDADLLTLVNQGHVMIATPAKKAFFCNVAPVPGSRSGR